MAPSQFFLLSRGFWEVERASGEEGEQRVLLEGRGGGGLKVVVIFGREGQGWGGWGHRRHGRGVGKLGALQEACSGNPPRDVNALSKRGPNPNPKSTSPVNVQHFSSGLIVEKVLCDGHQKSYRALVREDERVGCRSDVCVHSQLDGARV